MNGQGRSPADESNTSRISVAAAGRATHSVFLCVRVRKEDSAFVYFLLESYEGIASYSTLAFTPGDAHRDLELRIPPDFEAEVRGLLGRLGEMVYEIPAAELRPR